MYLLGLRLFLKEKRLQNLQKDGSKGLVSSINIMMMGKSRVTFGMIIL